GVAGLSGRRPGGHGHGRGQLPAVPAVPVAGPRLGGEGGAGGRSGTGAGRQHPAGPRPRAGDIPAMRRLRPVARPAALRPVVARAAELPARLAALARGHRWALGPTLTSVAASGTAAATTLVIARGIGPAAFGHFTVVLTIALIVTVGMLMSLHFVMYQELPRADPAAHRTLVSTALLATAGLTAAVAAAALLASPLLTV